ncbi:MAG: serine/threonine protein kinase [Myxococcales bacterium]|nr:serine/threonine protein kinase [Myxococcales bacterium]
MAFGAWLKKLLLRDDAAAVDGPSLGDDADAARAPAVGPAVQAEAREDVVLEAQKRPLAEGVAYAVDALARVDDRTAAQSLLRWLKQLVEGRALDAVTLVKLAEFYLARGDDPSAAAALTQVAEGSAREALYARLRLGDLAGQGGDIARALEWYEAVLADDLDFPGARERHARYKRPARAGDAGATLLAPDAGVALGRYALSRELGRGGAGAVYLADDRKLGRAVAVKIYHPSARADRGQRLRSEAQIAASIRSSFVVRVLDLQPALGALVMEHCAGGSLRGRIAHRDHGADEARRWLRELCRALAETHRAGWVHRDLKPGNVLLRRDGSVALTDFGLARRVDAEAPAMEGTAGYVPPEVLRGGRVAASADVYALGAIAAELGLADDPALGPWLARCRSSDPSQRPADAVAMLEGLL